MSASGAKGRPTDEELMDAYVDGDDAAFRDLFERYAPILLRLTRRHLRDDELAQEIVQQTFDGIVETLVEEGRIELRNFGVFDVKKRAARTARNPRPGDRVDVLPRRQLHRCHHHPQGHYAPGPPREIPRGSHGRHRRQRSGGPLSPRNFG